VNIQDVVSPALGRRQERESTHREIGSTTRSFKTAALVDLLTSKGLVAAPIHTVSQTAEFPAIRDKLLHARTPSGTEVRLPPPAVERDHLAACGRCLSYPPGYGEHTDAVLREAGLSQDEITQLRGRGTIA
jgi:formyl-CoA transferase